MTKLTLTLDNIKEYDFYSIGDKRDKKMEILMVKIYITLKLKTNVKNYFMMQ